MAIQKLFQMLFFLDTISIKGPIPDIISLILDDIDAVEESTLARLGRMLVSLARYLKCLQQL